jgi:hypothetical protein
MRVRKRSLTKQEASSVTDTVDSVPEQTRKSPPLPWLTWWFSAIFGVAVVALITTVVVASSTDSGTVELTIRQRGSDTPIAGAWIRVDGTVWATDNEGQVTLPASTKNKALEVSYDGFLTWSSDLGVGRTGSLTIELTPSGRTTNVAAQTGTQPDTASPSAAGPTSTPISASSPAATATPIPETVLEGKITDQAGKGIQGARIVIGDEVDITGKDGIFSLTADFAGQPSVPAKIIASGYLEQEIDVDRDSAPLEIALEPHKIKAIYLNPNITETDEDIDRLIAMIDSTELNAVVIDIKEELIFYDSQVPFFADLGTVQPRFDIDEMLKKFNDRGIYTIARLVVFKDSLVAEKRPDLAVMNNQTGNLWRDMNSVAWVNPMSHELWEANTDLALEAAQHGFDEIQFDYVRFPTDGDLTTMEFGLENTQDIRQRSIEKFLKMAQDKVHPTGAKLSADVFGYTMLVENDLGIGQNFARLAEFVDYLSPMIYPSHFPDGSIDVDGHPNSFPYETIEISLRKGRDKLGGDASKIRPWLQDFSFFDMMPYGDAEVRAQIKASNDIGTSGWMLWDPNNQYHPGALDPDEKAPPATPVGTPAAGATSVTDVRVRRRSSRPR